MSNRPHQPLDVTIAIPTLEGGAGFVALIERLLELAPPPRCVIVFDSGSSDGTAERARRAGFETRVIDRRDFDHGATRQAMAELAATRFVAFLSQDALPDRDYLGPLVEAMQDSRVAAATARILPAQSASPLAARTVLAAWQAGAEPFEIECDVARFATLTAPERRDLARLDDVASIVRRETLLTHPFPRTMMGEDVAFALSVLASGKRLRFEPRAVVRHSHEYGPLQAFARYREDAAFVRRTFGIRTRPNLFMTLRGIAYEVSKDLEYLKSERPLRAVREVVRSPWLRAAQVLGQWRGSLGAVA